MLLNFVVGVAVAGVLWRRSTRRLARGAGGAFLGFVLSRTIGLPGFYEGVGGNRNRVDIIEAAFVAVAVSGLSLRGRDG